MKKAAILYDFDKTLCDRDMQEYSLIPSLGYDKPSDFWKEVGLLSDANGMDGISAYLYMLKRKYEESGHPLKKEDFAGLGAGIELYPGVRDWSGRNTWMYICSSLRMRMDACMLPGTAPGYFPKR